MSSNKVIRKLIVDRTYLKLNSLFLFCCNRIPSFPGQRLQTKVTFHFINHRPISTSSSHSKFWFMGNGSSSNPEAMSSARDFVEEKLQSRRVVVFSKTWCGFCRNAKSALAKFNMKADDYEVVELDERDDGDSIQDYLKNLTGARSVPRVFIGGKCIGGGDDTVRMAQNGQLEKSLKEANAI